MKTVSSPAWPLVTVAIPCYNASKFLPILLPSILALDYPNLEIIIVDDHSTDNSVEYIEQNFPQIKLVKNPINKAFAAVANQLFWLSTGEYFFLVNQDTLYQSDYLKIAVSVMEKNTQIGAFGGKIYKYDFSKNQPTKIIDTVGQIIYKNRRIVDEGQGIADQGQFEKAGEVFGISGQNPLYRRTALLQSAVPVKGKIQPEIFDEDFYMYKEDVDLAWRLQLFGWKAWYDPSAVAWHGRGTTAIKRQNNLEIFQNRRLLSNFQQYYGIKNRYLLMLKNEFSSQYLRSFPFIFWNDLLYFGYNLAFNPITSFKAYYTLLRQLPSALHKRRYIVKHRRITPSQIAHWFK